MLKGAFNAVTRALAIEYAKEGIRVNTMRREWIPQCTTW